MTHIKLLFSTAFAFTKFNVIRFDAVNLVMNTLPATNAVVVDSDNVPHPIVFGTAIPQINNAVSIEFDTTDLSIGWTASIEQYDSVSRTLTSFADGVQFEQTIEQFQNNVQHSWLLNFDAIPVLTLTVEQQAVITAFTPEQQAVIATLTIEQQIVLATPTLITAPTAEQTAIINALSATEQLVFNPPITISTVFTRTPEQVAADKIAVDRIKTKLKNNEYITDDESVLLALGNSLMATTAMLIVDNGGGYNGLIDVGLSTTQAINVLSVYNITQDIDKYLSEVGLELLHDQPELLGNLKTYLAGLTPPLALPPITPFIAALRANHAVYVALQAWRG